MTRVFCQLSLLLHVPFPLVWSYTRTTDPSLLLQASGSNKQDDSMEPDGEYKRAYRKDNSPTVLIPAPAPAPAAPARPQTASASASSKPRSSSPTLARPQHKEEKVQQRSAAPKPRNNSPTLARVYKEKEEKVSVARPAQPRSGSPTLARPYNNSREEKIHSSQQGQRSVQDVLAERPRASAKAIRDGDRGGAAAPSSSSPTRPPPAIYKPKYHDAPEVHATPPRTQTTTQASVNSGTSGSVRKTKKVAVETVRTEIAPDGTKTTYKTISYKHVPDDGGTADNGMERGAPKVIASANSSSGGGGSRPPATAPAPPVMRSSTAPPPPTAAAAAAVPNNNPAVEELRAAISHAVNGGGRNYRVSAVDPSGGSVYHIVDGELCLNILCGCFAQYYEFEIRVVNPEQVVVTSLVPCGGCWGGVIGVAKNNDETDRVVAVLQLQVFTQHSVVKR